MPFLASLARGQQPSQHLAKLRHRTVDSTLHSTFARPQHPCQTLPPRPGQHPAHHDQRRALLRHSIWDNTLRSTFAKLRHHALDSTLHSTFARLRHRTLNSSLHSTLWSRRLKSSPPKTWPMRSKNPYSLLSGEKTKKQQKNNSPNPIIWGVHVIFFANVVTATPHRSHHIAKQLSIERHVLKATCPTFFGPTQNPMLYTLQNKWNSQECRLKNVSPYWIVFFEQKSCSPVEMRLVIVPCLGPPHSRNVVFGALVLWIRLRGKMHWHCYFLSSRKDTQTLPLQSGINVKTMLLRPPWLIRSFETSPQIGVPIMQKRNIRKQ